MQDVFTEVHNSELTGKDKLDFNLYASNGQILYEKGEKLDPGMLLKLNYTKVFKAEKAVKKLCDKCKEKYKLSEEQLDELFIHDGETEVFFYKPKGCTECDKTGYSGQITLHGNYKYDAMKKCLLGLTAITEITEI